MSIATVMIADDDPVMLAGLCLQARFHGLRPIGVGEGEVMALARAHRPRVIVLDIHQDGFDGRDVLAQLKADPLTQDSEVVVISGYADASTQAECLALGAAAFRCKPVEWEFMEEVARLAYSLSYTQHEAPWSDCFTGSYEVEVIELEDLEPSWPCEDVEISLED